MISLQTWEYIFPSAVKAAVTSDLCTLYYPLPVTLTVEENLRLFLCFACYKSLWTRASAKRLQRFSVNTEAAPSWQLAAL